MTAGKRTTTKTKQKTCKVHQKMPMKILFPAVHDLGLQSSSKVLGIQACYFFPLLFILPLGPGPILSKTSMFVHVIVLLYSNIE